MDASEEKFFETLAGTASDAGEQYEVELARAETVAAKPKAKPKIIESKDGGPAWDDDEPEGQLTVDVYQTPNDIVVESAIAGVRPEDLRAATVHPLDPVVPEQEHPHGPVLQVQGRPSLSPGSAPHEEPGQGRAQHQAEGKGQEGHAG